MTEKLPACGSYLEVDYAGGTTYETIDQIEVITPPTRQRVRIEANDLSACDLMVPILAGEQESEFRFRQYWNINDTDHKKVDTAFDSGDEAQFRLSTPSGTSGTYYTETFKGRVADLIPGELTKQGLQNREVVVVRTGAITLGSNTPP